VQHRVYARSIAVQLSIFGLALIALAIASTDDVLGFSAYSLAFHMTIEHLVFFTTGGLLPVLSYKLLKLVGKRLRRTLPRLELQDRHIFILLVVSALPIAFWHIPTIFAAAAFNENLHQIQHLSFIIAGSVASLAFREMSRAYLILLAILMGSLMGISGALLAVANNQLYSPYSITSQGEAGIAMIVMAVVMAVVIIPTMLINYSLKHELCANLNAHDNE